MADFTKDGSQIDEWAQIAADAIREGAAVSIPDDIQIALEVFVCHDSVNVHANGALVLIEVSGNITGDEDWSELVPVRSNGGTAVQVNVNIESTGTTLSVDSTGGSGEFETKFDRYFVKNNTIANSEIVRNNGFVDNVSITVLDSLTNTQQTTADVFNIVNSWIFHIPAEYRRARILIWNDDADCTICSRTRVAKVTDIE